MSLHSLIVFENSFFWVINKPAGLVVYPGSGWPFSTLYDLFITESVTPFFTHRLDKETSGLLLVAKDARTASRVSRLFLEKKVDKVYKAIVSGHLPESEGVISYPLWNNSKKVLVSSKGKEAQTFYRVEAFSSMHSLLELRPITGRKHQLRVHLSFMGCPILGDQKYASVADGYSDMFLSSVHLCIDALRLDIRIDVPLFFSTVQKQLF